MTLSLLTGPLAEPLDLADAKLHLRVDGTSEDSLIEGLIAAARLSVEANVGLGLITQTWKWVPEQRVGTDKTPRYELPLAPVSSIISVTVAGETLSPDAYSFVPGMTAKLAFKSTPSTADLAVIFTAGFGETANDVPRDLRHAIAMLVTHWFENRDPGGVGDVELPAPVTNLLSSYRKVRL